MPAASTVQISTSVTVRLPESCSGRINTASIAAITATDASTTAIMALGDKSCDTRSASATPVPLMAETDWRIPSIIGFISISSVHTAATPMVPTPMKRALVFHAAMA